GGGSGGCGEARGHRHAAPPCRQCGIGACGPLIERGPQKLLPTVRHPPHGWARDRANSVGLVGKTATRVFGGIAPQNTRRFRRALALNAYSPPVPNRSEGDQDFSLRVPETSDLRYVQPF